MAKLLGDLGSFRISLEPGEDRYRAERILTAAVLQINDKAPALFTGPPPPNTYPFDLSSYREEA